MPEFTTVLIQIPLTILVYEILCWLTEWFKRWRVRRRELAWRRRGINEAEIVPASPIIRLVGVPLERVDPYADSPFSGEMRKPSRRHDDEL